MKVLLIAGTRPEAIKLAILYKILKQSKSFNTYLYFTGQHDELGWPVLSSLGIEPEYSDELQHKHTGLNEKMFEIQTNIKNRIAEIQPDMVIVQGDTLSAYVGAQIAYLSRIPIAHVEAGLRTNDPSQPFPEEVFRKFIDSVAEIHFAPSEESAENVRRENPKAGNIFVTGNTGKDCFLEHVNSEEVQFRQELKEFLRRKPDEKILLLTMHRRENQSHLIEEVYQQLTDSLLKEDYKLIYISHPHTVQHNDQSKLLENDRVLCLPPLPFKEFIGLLKRVDLVLTDSGGVQEEAAYLNKPVIVLRQLSERNELLEKGIGQLYDPENFIRQISSMGQNVSRGEEVFGDGKASMKIVSILERLYLG